MKGKKSWKGILVLVLVFGIMLIGCETEPDDPTYTVWTETFNFSLSTDSWFADLQDGYHKYTELSKTDFDWEKANNFQNSHQNVWTEDQICSYLVGLGFSNAIAKEKAAWLASVNHGMLGSRTGSLLYIILK